MVRKVYYWDWERMDDLYGPMLIVIGIKDGVYELSDGTTGTDFTVASIR